MLSKYRRRLLSLFSFWVAIAYSWDAEAHVQEPLSAGSNDDQPEYIKRYTASLSSSSISNIKMLKQQQDRKEVWLKRLALVGDFIAVMSILRAQT